MYDSKEILSAMQSEAGHQELYLLGRKLSALAKQQCNSRCELIRIPNLFIDAATSVDPQSVVIQFFQLINSLNLKKSVGEENYVLANYKDDENSLKELVTQLHSAAGFYGEFNGVVGLKMDGSLDTSKMGYLFQLVEAHQTMTFLFFVPNASDDRLKKRFADELIKRIAIYRLKLYQPTAQQMLEHLDKQQKLKGLILTANAQTVLIQAISTLCESSAFAGRSTLDHLADEIAWHFIDSLHDKEEISVSDLSFLHANNSFVASFKEQSNRCIGFGEKG